MECNGCKDFGSCALIVNGSVAINNCPCRECILKMMCQEPCKKLSDHYYEVHGILKRMAEKEVERKV